MLESTLAKSFKSFTTLADFLTRWTTSFSYYLRNEGLLGGYVVRPAVLALGSGLHYDTGSVVLARDGALAILKPNTA